MNRDPTRTRLKKADLLRAMPYLRNLFRLHGYDVTRYPDEAIANAVLHVCPVVTSSWPTDAQLRAVVERLQRTD